MPKVLHKVAIVKKRTMKFTRHQSDRYSGLKVYLSPSKLFLRKTGANPVVLTIVSVAASRVSV